MNIDRWKVRRFHAPNLEQMDLWDMCVEGEGLVSGSTFERLGRVRLESSRRDGVEDGSAGLAGTLAVRPGSEPGAAILRGCE